MRPEPLPPGSTIGIFGGGQLGRFLAMAASKLGLRTAIYAPAEDSPAFQVASQRWQASYRDENALAQFAKACDVITFEFENVPAAALEIAARHTSVRPAVRAAEIAQDRISEKRFLSGLGLATAPYAAIEGEDELPAAASLLAQAGTGILKIAREGYDGKGQARVSSEAELRSAFLRFSSALRPGRPGSLLDGNLCHCRPIGRRRRLLLRLPRKHPWRGHPAQERRPGIMLSNGSNCSHRR